MMKSGVNKIIVNSLLLLIAAGLLAYIVVRPKTLIEINNNKPPVYKNVDVKFTENKYTLDYKNFDPLLVENIAIFNSDEKWISSGFYDTENYFEYPANLSLSAIDGNKIITQREVSINLSKVIDFDLVINSQTNSDDLEIAELIFLDERGKIAKYILPKLEKGQNIINFSKEKMETPLNFNWVKIVKVEFGFKPRPLVKIAVSLGGLRGEPGNILITDWNTNDRKMLLLDKRKDEISLLARNLGNAAATIRKITGADNFTFSSSVISLNTGPLGLFFRGNYADGYGYYFTIGGIGHNQWQLYKKSKEGTKILANGSISNFQIRAGEKYYLKVEVKGTEFKAYFSTNGFDFTLLTDIRDSDFSSGGVGLAVENAAIGLFNDFTFQQ